MSKDARRPSRPKSAGRVYTDLDALAGVWADVPGFDDAIESQDRVDEALWAGHPHPQQRET